MSTFIDRRLNPRDRSIKNRQKFIQRSREQIKKAVKESIDNGKIADIENGRARVKVKGVSEPTFREDPKSGDKRYVLPGNKDYVVGDKQNKPQGGEGEGGTRGGLGQGEDDFEFLLSPDEYMDFLFEELELPDLIKKQVADITQTKMKRAGYTNIGNPSQLDVVRSLKNSMGRRIGLRRPTQEEIDELEAQLAAADSDEERDRITLLLEELRHRMIAVPWLDPFDVRYRNFTPTPVPITRAVMVCILDCSGSMGQHEKDLAKRFYFLLHMFLRRKYQKVEIVFIRHHESAIECDEAEFFGSRESGGTVVSSGLNLAKKIIDERYGSDWNVYIAQASDGDNFQNDYDDTLKAMDELLPLAQYFAYVEVKGVYGIFGGGSDLWNTYEALLPNHSNLEMRRVNVVEDVWKVFKKLFSKEATK
jgi:uncharacterized sporulation protein YeaH/YhbH (DUF444 family)